MLQAFEAILSKEHDHFDQLISYGGFSPESVPVSPWCMLYSRPVS